MSGDLQIALGVVLFVLAVASPIVIMKVLKFKLELARINMETEIKKEEIRARNQLEIERMMLEEGKSTRYQSRAVNRIYDEEEETLKESTRREKLR